jgi:hypothetical protein
MMTTMYGLDAMLAPLPEIQRLAQKHIEKLREPSIQGMTGLDLTICALQTIGR